MLPAEEVDALELLRLGPVGLEQPAVRVGERIWSLTSLTDDIGGQFFATDGIARVRAALQNESLERLDLPLELRVGAPIARPSAVVCVGQNYAAHAAESGAEPPAAPIIFFKHPNTVVGPNDTVAIPPSSTTTDWEAELAVVIGKRTTRLARTTDAIDRIAGLTIADDVSDRKLQLENSGGQWSKGKSCPGFCPLGPALVPVDEISADALRIRSWVNDQARQDSTTADMIFGVSQLIYDISQYMTLEPGDLILTGTPQGVALSGRFPYLSDDDLVEIEIDGLGRQRHRFSASA